MSSKMSTNEMSPQEWDNLIKVAREQEITVKQNRANKRRTDTVKRIAQMASVARREDVRWS